jgi:hypothetical protein
MNEARWQALLEEAISHCYDEEDEFWAVFSALVGRVSYPLKAMVDGEEVSLTGLDGAASSPEAGIMARVEKGGVERIVPLECVHVAVSDAGGAEWLHVYRYWLTKR